MSTRLPSDAHIIYRCWIAPLYRRQSGSRGASLLPGPLQRSVTRPHCTTADRTLLVLLTGRLRTWRQALLIVRPETVLRWHRALFRRAWRRRSPSMAPAHRPPLAPEMVALIRQMAAANRLWGAERIRGELLKLDIRVAKRTIQKGMRMARPPHSGQTWATFVHNPAHGMWAADFLPVTDLLFRPLYAFFVIEPASRRVVHVGVTQHPHDAWVAHQLREATPYSQHPKHLITDNDSTDGPLVAQVAHATGIDHVRTAYRAPLMNAACERFLGSVRRECLDHVVVLNERHLLRVLHEYVIYFNAARPPTVARSRSGSTSAMGEDGLLLTACYYMWGDDRLINVEVQL